MPNVTIQDLFAKIGQLTIENEALRAENEALQKTLTEQDAPKMEAPKEK